MIHKTWDLTIRTTHQTLPAWVPPTSNNQSGFTIEGKMVQIRNHNVEDGSKNRFRYMAITIDISKARKREFSNGQELDTQYQTEVLDRKGFLNVYSHTKQVDPFEVSVQELRNQLQFVPNGNGKQVEFWASTNLVKAAEFQQNEPIRLKTLGKTIMVETITSLSTDKHGNYYGEDVLNRWDGKIQNAKSKDKEEVKSQHEGVHEAPVDDDEWE